MSDTANSLPTELRAFNACFAKYVAFNRRGMGFLLEQRARRLRWELWRQFKAIAKTPASLRAEIEARRGGIRRRQTASGKTVSLEREIRLRIRSLKFLSVSFLYQAWKNLREGQTGQFAARTRAQARIGEAIVRTAPGNPEPFVALTSFLAGVVKQDAQRGIAARALRAQTADMGTYVARKHQEELARNFNRMFSARLTVA